MNFNILTSNAIYYPMNLFIQLYSLYLEHISTGLHW